MIDLATQQITLLEAQIAEIGNTPNVSEAILARYASVQKELQLLQEANANYEKTEELKARTKALPLLAKQSGFLMILPMDNAP